ncbi:DUF2812 domain-containing protein [Amphibacillus sp. Q70]|uniref:DUF2812 domain-containing protein n=1 Tax=Amphibacillus sp. Q70 TaxID=3453416 RepID=UPI003F8546C4
MRKFKFFIDYNKEEKWLREMAQKGYQLNKVSFGYQFRESEPSDEIFRIDYRTFKKNVDFVDYCLMFEDSGWKHISGTKYSGAQYFQRIREDVSDDIFSDLSSKAGRYKRLSEASFAIAIPYLVLMIALWDSINLEAILNPSSLYLTPGLWDKVGFDFWKAFLFETPFAIMRGFSWIFIPIILILQLYFHYKAQKLYKQSKS